MIMKKCITTILVSLILCGCKNFNPEQYTEQLEDLAKYTNAYDEVVLTPPIFYPYDNRLVPIDDELYKYMEYDMPPEFMQWRYYGGWRSGLDSLQKGLKFNDPKIQVAKDSLINALICNYDNQKVEWSDFRKINDNTYEITELYTQSIYVLEQFNSYKKAESPMTLHEWTDEDLYNKYGDDFIDANFIDKIKSAWRYWFDYRWGTHIAIYRKNWELPEEETSLNNNN